MRPRDKYHSNLLKSVRKNNDIEMVEKEEEVHENTIIKIMPVTPRRRRRSAEI